MGAVVVVEGLRKAYGSTQALRGVDLTVNAGEVVAVLGPNGAGKTTLIEILEGFRRGDEGRVSVLGVDPAARDRSFRQRVGVVLQESGIDNFLSTREMLQMHAEYYDRPMSVEDVVARVGLTEKADAKVKTLSGGQRRRLDVGLGLIGDPELLFLDEPTTGFDPTARRQAWSVIKDLCSLGKTVLLTTHYMDEAQHLADRVVVVASGQVVAEGTPESIGGRGTAATRIGFEMPASVAVEALPPSLQATIDVDVAGDRDARRVRIETADPTTVLHALTSWAVERGVALAALTVDQPSLEDVYLELTKSAGGASEENGS